MTENKMGRPRIEIDREQFEYLCKIQCTLNEIASFFDCSMDTIERWCKREYEMTFADTFALKSGSGKVSLRRKQFQAALAGDKTMLVWLGKQMLSQTDKLDQNISGIKVNIVDDV